MEVMLKVYMSRITWCSDDMLIVGPRGESDDLVDVFFVGATTSVVSGHPRPWAASIAEQWGM